MGELDSFTRFIIQIVKRKHMKLLFAGDFCPYDRIVAAFEKENYGSVLSEVQLITSTVDYSFVNLECPVLSGDANPIKKHGPSLRCSPKGINALKYAGFDCVTLANNHFRDFGDTGVKETIEALNENGIEHVGGGMNIAEASKVLYKEIAGHRLAIINCCENEFSIATENRGGSNPLNPLRQYRDIREARQKADYVVVIVHGGHEQFQLPSPRMVETYRFFVDVGADAVVNHHQHCYSGYEVYNAKPIFYGLGNFCFDSPDHHSGDWTEGYFVTIDFSDTIQFELHPYCQCADKPEVVSLPKYSFDEKLSELNAIIADPVRLRDAVEKYYAGCASVYKSIFEPFYNRYCIAARIRGFFPSFMSKKRKLAAQNYVCCEAHRDKLMWWLNHGDKN